LIAPPIENDLRCGAVVQPAQPLQLGAFVQLIDFALSARLIRSVKQIKTIHIDR